MQRFPISVLPQRLVDEENHQAKASSIIVEFSGPPGSGKSTNCRYFSRALSQENLRVADFQDVKRYFNSLSLFGRWSLVFTTLRSELLRILSYVSLLIGNSLFSFDSLFRYSKLLIFNGALQEYIKRGAPDIVLLDQWALQGLWSAFVFKRRNLDHEKSLPHFLFPTHWLLYFDVDSSTAAARIAARETNSSRFDYMDAHSCHDALENYSTLLHRLYELSPCEHKHSFSTHESPENNAKHFVQLLKTSNV